MSGTIPGIPVDPADLQERLARERLAAEPKPGNRIGAYRLLRLLGQGTTGRVFVRPGPSITIGRAGWRILLPSFRFTLVQIAIGALDLTLITLAMYTVLPPDPPVGFITMMIPFLTAVT